jgi:hypothetical protein
MMTISRHTKSSIKINTNFQVMDKNQSIVDKEWHRFGETAIHAA